MPGSSELVSLQARVAALEHEVQRLEQALVRLLKEKPAKPSKREDGP
ncbi:MAG: hypothetical protein ACUVXH_06265 [Anaerolineae bacterium]